MLYYITFILICIILDITFLMRKLRVKRRNGKRTITYTIKNENGGTAKIQLPIDKNQKDPFSLTNNSNATLYCRKDGKICIYDTEEIVLNGYTELKLHDSGEKIKIHRMPPLFTISCCILLFIYTMLIVPAVYKHTIKPIAQSFSVIDDSDINHRFTQNVRHEKYVQNLLIIGTSGRLEESIKADTLMILSTNNQLQTAKLISLSRDLRVNVYREDITTIHSIDPTDPNYEMLKETMPKNKWIQTKLCETMQGIINTQEDTYLANINRVVDTIEYNFGFKIDDVLTVNLESFVKVIDGLGGVEIALNKEYVDEINNILNSEQNMLFGMNDSITYEGDNIYHLNGNEALAFVRMRYVGDNSDIARMDRQRKFVSELLEQKKNIIFSSDSIRVLCNAANNIQTTLNPDEVYQIFTKVLSKGYTFDTSHQLPYLYTNGNLYFREQTVNYIYLTKDMPSLKAQTETLLYGNTEAQ